MWGEERPAGGAQVSTQAAWREGERGAEEYNDSGGSELTIRERQPLGGLTAGPSGEPAIDIHGGSDSEEAGEQDRSKAHRNK
jgi:hypothetical protein